MLCFVLRVQIKANIFSIQNQMVHISTCQKRNITNLLSFLAFLILKPFQITSLARQKYTFKDVDNSDNSVEVLCRVLFRLCYSLPQKNSPRNKPRAFLWFNECHISCHFFPLNDRKVTETLFRISPTSLSISDHGFFL